MMHSRMLCVLWGALVCSACGASLDSAYRECLNDYRVLARECRPETTPMMSDCPACPPCTDTTGDTATLYSELDDSVMLRLLSEQGFEPELREPGVVRYHMDGIVALLFRKDETLQCYAGFRSQRPLEALNDWNREYRFTRAYLDQDGDVVLEMDLNLSGGVSLTNVRQFVWIFAVSVQTFVQFMREYDA